MEEVVHGASAKDETHLIRQWRRPLHFVRSIFLTWPLGFMRHLPPHIRNPDNPDTRPVKQKP